MARIIVSLTLICGALAACSDDASVLGPVSETVDDFEITVRVQDRSGSLVIDLEIRNRGPTQRSVQFESCNPTIEVYSTPPAETLVWDERQWRADLGSCLPVMRNADLAPGSAVATSHELMDLEMLGDSLAPGPYRVEVRFSMSQPEALLGLRAGNVTLER